MLLRPVCSCGWYLKLCRADMFTRILLAILDPEPYIIYNLLRLNDGNILLRIIWKDTFNTCVESSNIIVTCSRALVITIQTDLQNFVISTYIHKISHEHINPVSYHIVRMSHWWANVRMVKSRRIHSVCPRWYYCPITEQICVRKHIDL